MKTLLCIPLMFSGQGFKIAGYYFKEEIMVTCMTMLKITDSVSLIKYRAVFRKFFTYLMIFTLIFNSI